MSPSALRFSASATTTQCQVWLLPPVGACVASSRHSRITAISTGREKSSRLRTERVVVRTSSTVRFRWDMAGLQALKRTPIVGRSYGALRRQYTMRDRRALDRRALAPYIRTVRYGTERGRGHRRRTGGPRPADARTDSRRRAQALSSEGVSGDQHGGDPPGGWRRLERDRLPSLPEQRATLRRRHGASDDGAAG